VEDDLQYEEDDGSDLRERFLIGVSIMF